MRKRRPVGDQRQVDESLDGAIVSPAFDLAAVEIDAGAERRRVRLVGDEAQGAGHRARAECRSLRAVQHLDALDIVQMQIGRACRSNSSTCRRPRTRSRQRLA